jgi:hypothetical protein
MKHIFSQRFFVFLFFVFLYILVSLIIVMLSVVFFFINLILNFTINYNTILVD